MYIQDVSLDQHCIHTQSHAASKEVESRNHSFWHSNDYASHFLPFHITFFITFFAILFTSLKISSSTYKPLSEVRRLVVHCLNSMLCNYFFYYRHCKWQALRNCHLSYDWTKICLSSILSMIYTGCGFWFSLLSWLKIEFQTQRRRKRQSRLLLVIP